MAGRSPRGGGWHDVKRDAARRDAREGAREGERGAGPPQGPRSAEREAHDVGTCEGLAAAEAPRTPRRMDARDNTASRKERPRVAPPALAPQPPPHQRVRSALALRPRNPRRGRRREEHAGGDAGGILQVEPGRPLAPLATAGGVPPAVGQPEEDAAAYQLDAEEEAGVGRGQWVGRVRAPHPGAGAT